MDQASFNREFLSLLYGSDLWDFKIKFFLHQNDIIITLLCLILGRLVLLAGVGSTSENE